MSASIQEHIKFLHDVYQTLEEQRAAARKTELRDANRFNPFEFFTSDENGLSAVLAFLLNPEEKHGQGDLLLNAFLKHMKLHSFLGYDRIKITTEKTLNHSKRRHDIFIEGFLNNELSWVISIENKLRDAGDQKDQVKEYLEDLAKQHYAKGQQYCLIYLPPYEREPSEHSIKTEDLQVRLKENRLKLLDAAGLITWLEDAPIFAPKIQQFSEYFIQFLKEDILGEAMENNVLVNKILENATSLDSALEVIAVENQVREALWEKLGEQLQTYCNDETYPNLSKLNFKICDNYQPTNKNLMWLGFARETDEKQYYNIGVGIQFRDTQFNNMFYGAWWIDEETELFESIFNLEELREALEDLNLGKVKDCSDEFKACAFFSGNYLRNWDKTTWLKIQSGELANEIFEKLKPLLDIFEANVK